MRQREMDANGDYVFGRNEPFLVDSPLCVAQAIMTRLRLATGEWFLDLNEGTPYDTQILGHNTGATRDLAVRVRILETPGVSQISEYVSFVNTKREFVVVATVDTIYGKTDLLVTF